MPTARKKMEDKKLCKTGSGLERWRKPLAFLLLVLLILLLNHRFGWSAWLSDPENLGFLRSLIQENQAAAFLLYCLITIAACVVLALPGITFALLAGVLFGPGLYRRSRHCLSGGTLFPEGCG